MVTTDLGVRDGCCSGGGGFYMIHIGYLSDKRLIDLFLIGVKGREEILENVSME